MNHTTTLDQAIEDLRFIVSREDYTFAECSLAEEIVRRAESALLYVQAMKAKETQIAKGIPSAEGLEREAREHLERECGPIDCTLLLGEYSVCTLMVKFARKQLESHSRQLWLEAPWISVSERLPEAGQMVILTWANSGYREMVRYGRAKRDKFTHWLLVPDSPEINSDGE